MRLKDKVVIVTGGARGIGKVYALELAKEGADVVVSDILGEGAKETASQIQKAGGTALGIQTDITQEHETNNLADETVRAFGRIDVLVNNAGLYAGLKRRPFYEIDVDEWDHVMAVNLRGTFLCTKAVFPQMRKQNKGKIVNISSGAFFAGTPGFAHYVSSKGVWSDSREEYRAN
ncbi:MAG: SDR family oxidoreductase [Thaumarchaeota archaeon]|nr:SDR family oxidoreductase [Nitrososphaerota archaeon]